MSATPSELPASVPASSDTQRTPRPNLMQIQVQSCPNEVAVRVRPHVRTMGSLIELAEGSARKLDGWIERNGWAGYDPYDVKAHPIFMKRDPSVVEKVLRGTLSRLEYRAPLLLRKFLGVEKAINAKAMGLFAKGYLGLYRALQDDRYLTKAQEAIDWLDENRSNGYSGACWGYPFDWQSRVFIPKATPSSVVSSIAGNAHWAFYKLTGDRRYLDTCRDICEFFTTDLNICRIDDSRICFSYTPIDHFRVNNANLFVAEFLIKVGQELGREEFQQLGLEAANYTLSEQNADGSICYWGGERGEDGHIDHYHSGFELRSLHSISRLTGEERIRAATRRYYRFYLDNLFADRTLPKFTPRSTYPINIHSCAEALLCCATLSADFEEGTRYLINAARWTIENMQDESGYFYYLRTDRRVNRTPYVRWGQAWMLNALGTFLELYGRTM